MFSYTLEVGSGNILLWACLPFTSELVLVNVSYSHETEGMCAMCRVFPELCML